MKNLVIVESPTKARTIDKFLKNSFKIESSYGHVRDLPAKKLGINIKKDFDPYYIVPAKAKKIVDKLKEKAKKADAIYFATDEDREGEAIAWHLSKLLKSEPEKIKRITFHEITKSAVEQALENPRQIDKNLVDAQQARRILDRLVGYKLSPFLWRKVAKGLSAGRVQSVAVRLIAEREKEIQKFKPEEYWTIEAEFEKDKQKFGAKLHKINEKVLKKLEIKSADQADKILKDLENTNYKIADIKIKGVKKSPPAPFTTASLQQEANNKLGFSAKQTMRIAQQLYEGIDLGEQGTEGLITYMRTDSLNLSNKFLGEAKDFVNNEFGGKYALTKPRRFKTKSKGAQEAHEAIRPTLIRRKPNDIKKFLDKNQYRLYELIWKRSLATQMKEALLDSTSVDIKDSSKKYTFRANGSVIKFDGWLKIYPDNIKEDILPKLKEEDALKLIDLNSNQHFTQPPARYSDATLVKALEEYGIGRPSTYAPIISTVIERGYVQREEKRLKPTEIAFLVNNLLVEHFPKIVDYDFTAKLEKQLDEIAEGEKQWVPVVKEFYKPFEEKLMKKEKEVSKKEITEEKTTEEKCPKCGKPLVEKMSKYGRFLACSGFPECRYTQPMEEESQEPQETDEVCKKCGAKMVIKKGRYGQFLGCSNYPDCKNMKPLVKSTGVKCPECGKGKIVERKSRKGKIFYSCDQYPECKFALWQRPTGEKCPECGSLLVYYGKDKVRCSNQECKYKKS